MDQQAARPSTSGIPTAIRVVLRAKVDAAGWSRRAGVRSALVARELQKEGTFVSMIQPVANGLRTDHPVPGLPFINDERLPLQA
ncbi:hypothetical protein ACICHK_43685 (plasmid) [Streptomyces sp. AHU1]|uniref:hypothetical protein n=1 Tax=Streptomyces sp. AHU1 TaxID=3377215 RepID=UPI00387817B2